MGGEGVTIIEMQVRWYKTCKSCANNEHTLITPTHWLKQISKIINILIQQIKERSNSVFNQIQGERSFVDCKMIFLVCKEHDQQIIDNGLHWLKSLTPKAFY